MPHDLAIDCGSGGTRVFHWSAEQGPIRLPWPIGERAPVLAAALASEAGRREFAAALEQYAKGGKTIFVGATAGLRSAIEKGNVNVSDVDAFRGLLPAGCEFHIISPLEEAQYEYRALVAQCSDPSVSMMSMGGQSMQLGREGALYSLPFAMHLGYHGLQDSHVSWPETVASVAALYDSRCIEVKVGQSLTPLDGVIVGVTDTIDVAVALKLLDQKITPRAFLEVLECCISDYASREKTSLVRVDFVLLARALLLRVVVNHLMAPTCELLFKDEWRVNWTAGYFLEARL